MLIGVHLINLQGDDNIHSDDRACVMYDGEDLW